MNVVGRDVGREFSGEGGSFEAGTEQSDIQTSFFSV